MLFGQGLTCLEGNEPTMGMKAVFSVARSLTSAGIGIEASRTRTGVSGARIGPLDCLLRFFPEVEAMLVGIYHRKSNSCLWLGFDY